MEWPLGAEDSSEMWGKGDVEEELFCCKMPDKITTQPLQLEKQFLLSAAVPSVYCITKIAWNYKVTKNNPSLCLERASVHLW